MLTVIWLVMAMLIIAVGISWILAVGMSIAFIILFAIDDFFLNNLRHNVAAYDV